MQRIGLAVPNLGPSQPTYYLVRNANAALLTDPTLDITAFVEAQVPPSLAANFATMPMYEAWGYSGVLVATTFSTARTALRCLGPRATFLYAWDLEWLRPHLARPYREWASVYRDPQLHLLARSAEHALALERAWNRPVVGVVDDFDIARLLEAVR